MPWSWVIFWLGQNFTIKYKTSWNLSSEDLKLKFQVNQNLLAVKEVWGLFGTPDIPPIYNTVTPLWLVKMFDLLGIIISNFQKKNFSSRHTRLWSSVSMEKIGGNCKSSETSSLIKNPVCVLKPAKIIYIRSVSPPSSDYLRPVSGQGFRSKLLVRLTFLLCNGESSFLEVSPCMLRLTTITIHLQIWCIVATR